jgi:ferritin-like metal-binding protein YciE
MENLKDLLIEQGRELYDASRQEQKELPKIQQQVTNPKLRNVIARQLDTARTQTQRLQDAFRKLNASPEGEKNECAQSILKQAKSLIDRSRDAEIRDAAIVNTIQRLNHTKVASFGSLASYAREIGQEDLARMFHESAASEKDFDRELTQLAEKEINRNAVTATAM